jgi:CRISPR-associated protein Cmr4
MNKNVKTYWLHALSSVHVGIGRGVGYIDLPIIREKVTNWPFIPGSAFKGVYRDYNKESKKEDLEIAFGKGGNSNENGNAGALVFTDARLICLPVRSLYGTFAWCTSPMVLRRLRRDLDAVGVVKSCKVPESIDNGKILIADDSVLEVDGNVFLEDLDFKGQDNSEEKNIAESWGESLGKMVFFDTREWQKEFIERFTIVSDDIFNFLGETGTEVTTRIRLDEEQKTVKDGHLWTEESLPAESILSGLVWSDPGLSKDNGDLLERFCSSSKSHSLQIGGNSNIGKGRMLCRFFDHNKEGSHD